MEGAGGIPQAKTHKRKFKAIPVPNAEYDMDDVMVSRAAAEAGASDEAVRDRSKAISEHRKLSKVLDLCKFCFGTKSHQKHLMIALGKTWYVALS